MQLPLRERAFVPQAKLIGYLLSEDHPIGRTKAAFFRAHGFDENNAPELERGLLEIAHSADVAVVDPTPFGTKYVLDGFVSTPEGGAVELRTVWIIEIDADQPRFVTAYPN